LPVSCNVTYQLLPLSFSENEDNLYVFCFNKAAPKIRKALSRFLKNAIVVHYNHQTKPWSVACKNPLRYIFNEHLIRFAESKEGKCHLLGNFEIQLVCLVTSVMIAKKNDISSRLLVAFAMHSQCVRLTATKFRFYREKLISHYKAQCYHEFKIINAEQEFQKNQVLLDHIHKNPWKIGLRKTNNSRGTPAFCEWKIFEQEFRKHKNTGVNDPVIILEMINTELGIFSISRILLYYFILRNMKIVLF
jgi:hypothetical protein